MAHPQAGMAALVGVRGRAAPVLHEEQPQPIAGAGQVGRLRVQPHEQRIPGDTVVEHIDEPREERLAADDVVQPLSVGGHRVTVPSPPWPSAATARASCRPRSPPTSPSGRPHPTTSSPSCRSHPRARAGGRDADRPRPGCPADPADPAGRGPPAVEVGTFTGFSSICIARGGSLRRVACCAAPSARPTPPYAREAWAAAGLDRRHRAEDRTGPRDAAGAAHRARHRPGVHRRRQGRLRQLLRRARAAGAARRAAARRQHAVVGPRRRRRRRRTTTRSPSAPSTTWSPPTSASRATCCRWATASR